MKPILFNTDMVKAIMDGRKTVTRRLVKNKDIINAWDCEADGTPIAWIDQGTGDSYAPTMPCRYQPGDILYVRETWCKGKVAYGEEPDGRCVPFISQCPGEDDIIPKELAIREGIGIEDVVWKPSIFMPKEAARIFLRVKSVRVERLQAITADECPMEGTPLFSGLVGDRERFYKESFAKLWDSTVKAAELDTYGWEANPWVWVIEFERIKKEDIDHG